MFAPNAQKVEGKPSDLHRLAIYLSIHARMTVRLGNLTIIYREIKAK